MSEDERRCMAKQDLKNAKRVTIDAAHEPTKNPTSTLPQGGSNTGYSMTTSLRWGLLKIRYDNKRVRFAMANSVTKFNSADIVAMITYDSGADGNYIIKADKK